MKREFLEGLKLEAGVVDKIMAENGKDIEREKSKFADYDNLKEQIKKANETIEKFKDYDKTKADVEKYKEEVKKAQEESKKAQEEANTKIQQMELRQKVKDVTSLKKFVNDFTRDSINAQIEAELNKPESRGKNVEDVLKTLTDGKDNIFVDETKATPPVVGKMGGTPPKTVDDAQARAVMGLPIQKD